MEVTPKDPKPKAILVVEDDSNDVLLFKRALQKAGLFNPVFHAEDGDQAIHYVLGKGRFRDRNTFPLPAVVILDLKLPRKSGLEFLSWLRSQPSTLRRLPVVILSSSRQQIDIDRCYDLGANSYLVKPSQFESLIETVRMVEVYWMQLNEGPEIRRET